KGPLAATAMEPGLEVRAGKVSFRTTRGLDVLPIEGRFYFKKSVDSAPDVVSYYQQLYASYRGSAPTIAPQLYQATPFPMPCGKALALGDTVDGYIWLALCLRTADKPPATQLTLARRAIANHTLTIGIVPALENAQVTLPP